MGPNLAYYALRFVTGIAVLLGSGAGVPGAFAKATVGKGNFLTFDVLCGLLGFWWAMSSVSPLVRAMSIERKLEKQWGKAGHSFARMRPEQHVFLLLLGVAEADGTAGPRERDLVRTFLLQRFPSPQIRIEVERWTEKAPPLDALGTLARALAIRFGRGECSTLYSWCCLVAFADGGLHASEDKALRAIAVGLGLEDRYAQFLFDYARTAHERSRANGQSSGQGSGQSNSESGSQQRRTNSAPPPSTPREAALRTLGLPTQATPDEIRRRHRELVRRFHPDAQPKLGPIAMAEATERFKAIQRAYEELAR